MPSFETLSKEPLFGPPLTPGEREQNTLLTVSTTGILEQLYVAQKLSVVSEGPDLQDQKDGLVRFTHR